LEKYDTLSGEGGSNEAHHAEGHHLAG
jgi:hypothetical protein